MRPATARSMVAIRLIRTASEKTASAVRFPLGYALSGLPASSLLKEQASRTQHAGSAPRLPRSTEKRGEVEQSPIEFLGSFLRDDGMGQFLQAGIIANVRKLSRPKESLQDARHIHIQERLRSMLGEEEYRIRDVLAHAGQPFNLLPCARKPAATARHLPCQTPDGNGPPFPEAKRLENGLEICLLG